MQHSLFPDLCFLLFAVIFPIAVNELFDCLLLKIQEDLLAKNLKAIHDITVETTVVANEEGHLFAGIHSIEIAPIVKSATGIDILPEFIQLEKPIKTTGEHKIDVKVQGKSATFTLVVKAK